MKVPAGHCLHTPPYLAHPSRQRQSFPSQVSLGAHLGTQTPLSFLTKPNLHVQPPVVTSEISGSTHILMQAPLDGVNPGRHTQAVLSALGAEFRMQVWQANLSTAKNWLISFHTQAESWSFGIEPAGHCLQTPPYLAYPSRQKQPFPFQNS